jgi:hypothetical protein
MAVIACPECGLPRERDEVAVVPCPVCAFTSAPLCTPANPLPKESQPVDPVAGLPADVNQMEAYEAATSGRPRFQLAAALLVGIALGVGGLLAGQQILSVVRSRPVEVAQAPPRAAYSGGLVPPPVIASIAVAPMPHEPRPRESVIVPTPDPKPVARVEPKAEDAAPAVARKVFIDLNQPDASYTVPRTVRKGEHIVLRGKLRILRANGVGQGGILDASELEAGSIYIDGKIESGAVLKLSCIDGVVEVPASVGGKSRVDIDAPGSSVRFSHPTTANKPGSLIDGGSTVTITARTVDLRGDVDGAGTKVRVTLTRNGWLRAAAVRGAATVEYKPENPKLPEPTASAEIIAPTATFRKLQ